MKHYFIKGSNKYSKKYKGLKPIVIRSLIKLAFTVISMVAIIQWFKLAEREQYYQWRDANVIAPCANFCAFKGQIYAQEPDNRPTLENITKYIIKKFEPEGRNVAVKALACFISESGLRADAFNGNNTNGTSDYGVAQVNTVHLKRFGNDFTTNWMSNIDVAFKIYKERGWSAWYGKYCN
jgi:hypothetical protein